MPRLNQPPSLKRLSLQTLVKSFEVICYGCARGAPINRLIESDLYSQFDGPFEHWPSSLLEEVLVEVIRQRSASRVFLHLLIQPHLESFSLPVGQGEVYYAIEFLLKRCRNLQRLEVTYLSFIGPPLIVKIVHSLPHLRSLNLRMTPTTDEVLRVVGDNCPHIRDLDVSAGAVTDRGLIDLIYDQETGDTRAQQLSRLSVTETKITAKALSFALRSLPNLRYIEHEQLIQVFNHLTDDRLLEEDEEDECDDQENCTTRGSMATNQYGLMSLDSPVDSGANLTMATLMCPDLRSVSLVAGSQLANASIWSLSRLSHLSHLSIANGPGLELDFYAAIVPLLHSCGHQLRNLILTRFTSVDVFVIGASCQHLRNLALSEIFHFADSGPTDHGTSAAGTVVFNQLEALELWAFPGVRLPIAVIRQLLTPCRSIQNLLFRGCEYISDSTFTSELWPTNPMNQLSHVTFDGCHQITHRLVDALLARDNDLTLLRLWNCQQLTKGDYLKWKSIQMLGNMDLHIDFYPFTELG